MNPQRLYQGELLQHQPPQHQPPQHQPPQHQSPQHQSPQPQPLSPLQELQLAILMQDESQTRYLGWGRTLVYQFWFDDQFFHHRQEPIRYRRNFHDELIAYDRIPIYYTSSRFQQTISKKKARKNDKACSICLVHIDKGDLIANLQCDHYFHYQCLQEWGKQAFTCPVCRRRLKSSNNPQPQIQIFQYQELKDNFTSEKREKQILKKLGQIQRELEKQKEKQNKKYCQKNEKCQQAFMFRFFKQRYTKFKIENEVIKSRENYCQQSL